MHQDGIQFSDEDYKIMIDAAKHTYGDDEIAVQKSIQNQIEYANLVSNL
jgi:hypothetical protein